VSVEIPWQRIKTFVLRPQLFSGNQEGTLGGPTLQIPRRGDRFAADIGTSRWRQDSEARLFIAALFEATTGDAIMEVRQPNLPDRPSAGTPVVDGVDQAGTTVALRGMTPNLVLERGQVFNIIHADVHYLYMIMAETVVDAAGDASLAIWPMLRFLTVDGEPCEIDEPKIEGQLVGFDKGSTWVRNRTDPIAFSIVERA